jgi:hypothetical protein
MKVIVTGGRDYRNSTHLFRVLDQLHSEKPITLLIHGAARGADALADDWARMRGVPLAPFPADWDNYGRSAGAVRNREMLKEEPDLVVAFAGGKGTADMIKAARKAGVKVFEAYQ